jgi:L,D-peptidoglycan transpeptidase YkuD (ErfK/YbiS/YcfS/YnhG family)
MHIAKKKYKKTAGCIGLKKSDLLKLIKIIKKKTKVIIN